jgi:type I restriction enzyme R subunit
MANSKEAKARLKINKLLEEAGWRFFDDKKGEANIQLEPNVKLNQKDIDAFGENFEITKNGFIDFLLLDDKGFPFVVLEAKKEDKKSTGRKRASEKIRTKHKCSFRNSF